MASLPSEQVRALAEIVKRTWAPFTDAERLAFLIMINETRAPLDAATITEMLAATGQNIGLAAKNLGVCRRTLQSKMRAFDMERGTHGRRKK